MKKIITILLMAVFTAGVFETTAATVTMVPACSAPVGDAPASAKKDASQEAKKVNSGAVTGLIREYNLEKGFEVVSVGGLGLGLIRMIANASVDEEEKAALGIMDKLRRVVVLDYEDADPSKRESFTRRMNNILDGAEKIMEVKDGEDILDIYGTGADDGDSIDDLIIFSPGECALICFFGSISAQAISDIITMADE